QRRWIRRRGRILSPNAVVHFCMRDLTCVHPHRPHLCRTGNGMHEIAVCSPPRYHTAHDKAVADLAAVSGEEFSPRMLQRPTPAAKAIGIKRNDYPLLLFLRFIYIPTRGHVCV